MEELHGFVGKGHLEALVSFLVDDKGAVSNTEIAQSSGNYDFDTDALVAARKWKFKPAT